MKQLTTLTDEELISVYASGNDDAFDVLFQRYRNDLYSYITGLVKSSEIADDIFQETLIKIILTLRRGAYTESGKFSFWIHRIARNLAIDYFRQEKIDNVFSIDFDPTEIANDNSLAELTAEDIMIARQYESAIKDLLAELPDDQREVVEMRIYNDLTFREIAEATGVSLNTALGRMRYALMRLRRMIAERSGDLEN